MRPDDCKQFSRGRHNLSNGVIATGGEVPSDPSSQSAPMYPRYESAQLGVRTLPGVNPVCGRTPRCVLVHLCQGFRSRRRIVGRAMALTEDDKSAGRGNLGPQIWSSSVSTGLCPRQQRILRNPERFAVTPIQGWRLNGGANAALDQSCSYSHCVQRRRHSAVRDICGGPYASGVRTVAAGRSRPAGAYSEKGKLV